MDKEIIKKETDKVKAQAKKVFDDNKKLAEKEIAKMKKEAEKTLKKAEAYAKKNPEKAALITAGIGAALGAVATALIAGGKKSKK